MTPCPSVPYLFYMGIETLGEAFDAGWRVTAKCQGLLWVGERLQGSCWEKTDLTMETLVWTRGRDLPLRGLADRLRCPRCGSRNVKVMFDIPTVPNAARQRRASG